MGNLSCTQQTQNLPHSEGHVKIGEGMQLLIKPAMQEMNGFISVRIR